MWRVLIADDEPKIRRGMRAALGQSFSDIDIVGEAEDGEQALELAKALRPDILLIDIRMPFLDGLQLAERLAHIGNDWCIIVVSGHDEFEYARKALTLKVFDFLLKPVSHELLTRTIERAKDQLALTRESNKYLAWAKDQLQENLGALKETFLRQWLNGNLSATEVAESTEFLSIRLPERPQLMVVGFSEPSTSIGPFKEGFRKLMIYAVKSLVEESLKDCGQVYVFVDDTENVIALTEFRSTETTNALAQGMEKAIHDRIHQNPVIVVETLDEGKYPHEAYEDALEELSRRGNLESFVRLAQAFIDQNYHKPDLSLENVAENLEISPGYLSRLMKHAIGLSFIEYLSRIRIQHALRLMNDPAVKVFEAASQVGYRSQHYFSRAFRKILGVSPSEYRKGASIK